MKKMGIIQVPKGGKVSWLIKGINDSFVQNELNNIERKIYDMMDEVNFNENWAANTSAQQTTQFGKPSVYAAGFYGKCYFAAVTQPLLIHSQKRK